MDNLLENNNVILSTSDSELLDILTTVYEQQRYMFENNTHTVENRIVSISQPYIRPIVRGKAKSPVEFGAKLDLSVDEIGMCRLEKLSFDAYNESAVLKTAIENYKQRTGHYPERVLVDQIYRNRENISFCNSLCIRISGKKLGRPKKDVDTKAEKKTADRQPRPGLYLQAGRPSGPAAGPHRRNSRRPAPAGAGPGRAGRHAGGKRRRALCR